MPAETMGYVPSLEEETLEQTALTPRAKTEVTEHDWELYLDPRFDGSKVAPRMVERLNIDLDSRTKKLPEDKGYLSATQRARIGEQTQATVAWHLRRVESSWLDTLANKVKQPGSPVEDPMTMAAVLADMGHLAREGKAATQAGQAPTSPDQLRRRIAANRDKLSGNDQHLLLRVAWIVKGTAEGVARDTYNEGYPTSTGIIVVGMDPATKAHFDQAEAWFLAKDPNQLSELQKEQKKHYPDDVKSIFGDFAFYRKDLNGKVQLHHRKPKVTFPMVGSPSLS